MLLFKIDRRNNVIMVPEAARLTDHCRRLTEEELRFLVLAYDYYSPLKQYPPKERIQKAKRMVWGKDEKDNFFPEKEKNLEKAIIEYQELQYDPLRETIRAYEQKIELLTHQLISTKTPGTVAKIDADIETLQNRIKSMQEEVDRLEDNVRMKTKGDKLSLIEQWQRNRIRSRKDGEIRKRLEKEKEFEAEA